MTAYKRFVAHMTLFSFTLATAPLPARAADDDGPPPECDVQRALQQAQAYRRADQLGPARGEIEMAIRTEAGYEDPTVRVWLAIIAFAQNDFQTSGRMLASLGGLTEPLPDNPSRTVERFLEFFPANMGTVIVESKGAPDLIAFRAELDAPPLTTEQGDLIARFLDRQKNVVKVRVGEKLYIPAGSYRLGNATVEVYAGGDPIVLPIESIGDPKDVYAAASQSPDPEPVEMVKPPQWDTCAEVEVEGYKDDRPWAARNKWWLIGGGIAVAAIIGVAAGAAAASTTEYDVGFGARR